MLRAQTGNPAARRSATAVGHLGLTVLTAGLVRDALTTLTAPGLLSQRSLDVLLTATAELAVAVVWLALTWLFLVVLAAVVTGAVAGTTSVAHLRTLRLAPTAGRRTVALLLGIAVLGTTATACAAPEPAGRISPGAQAISGTGELDRPAAAQHTASPPPALAGWTPDRPVDVHRMTPIEHAAVQWAAAKPRHQRRLEEVVVRGGDTLWDIAARHLGPQASLAQVAAAWPRWYAANRTVIGPRPDLLRPGERLRPPDRAS